MSALTAQISELGRAGKTSQAIPLAQRLLANMEKAHGPVDRDVAAALNNLALLYGNQGRDADAEPLYRRALAILEKLDGLDYSEIAPELNNLAALYQRQGRYAEAEPLFKRSLAIREKALGRDHPDVAQSLNNLAAVYERQLRHADAEPLFKRALAIDEKALGPDHPAVATLLNNLGQLEKSDGRAAEAEPVIRRSLAIRVKVLGSDHPDVARSLNNLADLYERLGRGPTPNRSISGHWRSASARWVPIILTSRPRWAIWPPSTRHRDAPGIHCRWCNARSQAAGRNRDQDLAAEADALDKAIVAAVSKERSKRDAAAEQRGRDRLAATAVERATLQKTFATEFPYYAALSNPLPMTMKEIQALLSGDEAMVPFSVVDTQSYVFAMTRDNFDWKPVPSGADALTQKVAAFRHGLDPNKISDANGMPDHSGLFDLALANALYVTLLGPVEASSPRNAYAAFWEPFALIGEGASH